jgi:hypothetical protein
MIINRTYETQKLLSLYLDSFLDVYVIISTPVRTEVLVNP